MLGQSARDGRWIVVILAGIMVSTGTTVAAPGLAGLGSVDEHVTDPGPRAIAQATSASPTPLDAAEDLLAARSQTPGPLDADALDAIGSLDDGLDRFGPIVTADHHEADLSSLAAVVEAVDAWQADSPGTTAPAITSSEASAGQALVDLVEALGHDPARLDASTVDALDALDGPVGDALADLFTSFQRFDQATEGALAHLDPATVPTLDEPPAKPGPVPAWDGQQAGGPPAAQAHVASPPTVDWTTTVAARAALIDAIVELEHALSLEPDAPTRGVPSVTVPGVVALDLDGVDNHYTANYALVVDVGGDDRHENNAGGSAVAQDPCDLGLAPGFPGAPGAATLVDLAGEDTYGDASAACPWAQTGGGYLGSGLLVDAGGSDTYQAQVASTGSGLAGTGLLIDAAGDDTYDGARGAYTVHGSAYIAGQGALVDGGGNDTYVARSVVVNGGAYQQAAGALVDLGGHDAYTAWGAWANGGAGLQASGALVDATGNDRYTAYGGVSNGAGFDSGAAGLLVDGDGDDVYDGLWTNSNGGGFVGGAGALVDVAGQDEYFAYLGASNGGAAFAAAGFLVDGAGADLYHAPRSAVNGGGVELAAGHLVDQGGDDAYTAASSSAGGLSWSGANGGAVNGAQGLLLDTEGDDAYRAPRAVGGNGGAGHVDQVFCQLTTCPKLPAAQGLLLDGGGADRYDDSEGGSGEDVTVVPKGTLGAQIDG